MTPDTQVTEQINGAATLITSLVQPNSYALLRHLGDVLGIRAEHQVLVIADIDRRSRTTLKRTWGSAPTLFQGDLSQLPFDSASFDIAIVAVPVTRRLHTVARELSRVLKANGSLGMVALSPYRDQLAEELPIYEQLSPLVSALRPAAAYRAVLAETGFTAFVSEDRRDDTRGSTLASYKQYFARRTTGDAYVQALDLIGSGSVRLTLITAEKGL